MTGRTDFVGPAPVDPLRGLNPRDIEVLQCLAEGNSTAQIAAAMDFRIAVFDARTRCNSVDPLRGRAIAARRSRRVTMANGSSLSGTLRAL